jgi:DNA-directed RNA polymerase I subunit RPA1
MLTQKDNFLTRDEYYQLVYSALEGLPQYQSDPKSRVHLLPPAILKPKPLWTGKQVISSLLFGLTGDLPEPACYMNVERKAKVSAKMWGEDDKLPGTGRKRVCG